MRMVLSHAMRTPWSVLSFQKRTPPQRFDSYVSIATTSDACTHRVSHQCMALSQTYQHGTTTRGYYNSPSSSSSLLLLLNSVTMRNRPSFDRRVMCSATDGTKYPYEPQQVCHDHFHVHGGLRQRRSPESDDLQRLDLNTVLVDLK
jgi:hypothetical protein